MVRNNLFHFIFTIEFFLSYWATSKVEIINVDSCRQENAYFGFFRGSMIIKWWSIRPKEGAQLELFSQPFSFGKNNMTKVKFFWERENELVCTPLFEAKHLDQIFACVWHQNLVIVCLLLAWQCQIDFELTKCQSLNKITHSQKK